MDMWIVFGIVAAVVGLILLGSTMFLGDDDDDSGY